MTSSTPAFTSAMPVLTNRLNSRPASLTALRRPFLPSTSTTIPLIHHAPHFTSSPSMSVSSPRPKPTKTSRRSSSSRPNSSSSKGKRVATFRKLQARHRSGPATFRQEVDEKNNNNKQLITKNGIISTTVTDNNNIRKIEVRDRRNAIQLKDINVGDKYIGRVHNIVRHGAYVDIGATRDGLVHVRDMSVDFVHEVEDIVRPNDEVTVWIKYVNADENVLGLTMCPPVVGFDLHNERLKITQVKQGLRTRGVVQRLTNFGAYIDIGCERLAFLHVRRLWGRRQRETLINLKLGQVVTVHVIEVDEIRSYIGLSARGRRGFPLTEQCEFVMDEQVGYVDDDDNDNDERHHHQRTGINDTNINNTKDIVMGNAEKVRQMAVLRYGEELHDTYDSGLVVEEEEEEEKIDNVQETNEEENIQDNDNDELDASAFDSQEWEEEEETQNQFKNFSVVTDDDDDDDDEDEDEDEFGFVDEMNSDHVNQKGIDKEESIGEISHMLDDSTEYVGLDPGDIENLQKLKKRLQSVE